MAKKAKGEAVRRVELRKELEVDLTPEQIAEASREHVEALEAIDKEIDAFADTKREHKNLLGDIKARERRLRNIVQTGQRPALVACERLIDYAAAKVEERRLDTGELITQRPMTAEEGELVMAEIVPDDRMEIVYADGASVLALPAPEMSASDLNRVGDVIPVLTEDLRAKVLEIMRETRRASTAMLQRRLKLSFVAADGVMQALEGEGILSAPDHGGARQIVANLWGDIPGV